jgi:hypothetical protein
METPAGFEPNSKQVANRVGEYLKNRLQNYDPIVDVVPARKRGTDFSPDDAEILQPLIKANIIFMGAGSPTYAVRELENSLAWGIVRARFRMGANLVFASAGTIAVSKFALPVYEIYKVGEDIRAVNGLNLLADYGLSISFIPHWNNSDGGLDVDTSRCFIGQDRFEKWYCMVSPSSSVLGMDEHTGLIIDIEARNCSVVGVGSVTRLNKKEVEIFPAGSEFPIDTLGDDNRPVLPGQGIPNKAWEMVKDNFEDQNLEEIPTVVSRLSKERQEARLRKDWNSADLLRDQISNLGWMVEDTPQGQKIIRRP